MNLYWVCMKDADWGMFVFAETRNKARAMCVNYFSDDEDYPSLCAYLRAKNVEGPEGIADSDDPEDKTYKRVLKLGFKFDEESEDKDERELAICTDCDTYEVCPLIGHEARGECEKIKRERGQVK